MLDRRSFFLSWNIVDKCSFMSSLSILPCFHFQTCWLFAFTTIFTADVGPWVSSTGGISVQVCTESFFLSTLPKPETFTPNVVCLNVLVTTLEKWMRITFLCYMGVKCTYKSELIIVPKTWIAKFPYSSFSPFLKISWHLYKVEQRLYI